MTNAPTLNTAVSWIGSVHSLVHSQCTGMLWDDTTNCAELEDDRSVKQLVLMIISECSGICGKQLMVTANDEDLIAMIFQSCTIMKILIALL